MNDTDLVSNMGNPLETQVQAKAGGEAQAQVQAEAGGEARAQAQAGGPNQNVMPQEVATEDHSTHSPAVTFTPALEHASSIPFSRPRVAVDMGKAGLQANETDDVAESLEVQSKGPTNYVDMNFIPLPRSDWKSSACCFSCSKEYGWLQKQHHCRRCGASICEACSRNSQVPEKRICRFCFEYLEIPENQKKEKIPPDPSSELADRLSEEGYSTEVHTITTADGYKLNCIRLLPRGLEAGDPDESTDAACTRMGDGVEARKAPPMPPTANAARPTTSPQADPADTSGHLDGMTSKPLPQAGRDAPVGLTDDDHLNLHCLDDDPLPPAPRTGGGRVVFLQHGLMDSAATWVLNTPQRSLAYILADAGFDVWLGNSRGNKYSLGHTHHAHNASKFWQFDFDQMAHFDVPACIIDYILRYTGMPSLVYVGHSQGTTIGFISFSDPAVAAKVSLFIALAPVASLKHTKIKTIRALSVMKTDTLVSLFGPNSFITTPRRMEQIVPGLSLLSHSLINSSLAAILDVLGGWNEANFDKSRIPVLLAHSPGGTSVRNMVHWAQSVRSGKFRMFSFGPRKNKTVYKSTGGRPPLYLLSEVRVRVALFMGGKDTFTDQKDLARVMHELPRPVFIKQLQDYTHNDFVWGLDAAERLYPHVLALIDRYSEPAILPSSL
eukprot:CAMPEP_0177642424 /NCGR_PEP_ID=MMETSP0447-20121125/7579_1 /TAXON_ID=0 /ORGANISM="Stygamoeba regulata, Strain BSH-02190019" /LENGTH=665 /DNA_ID=CAMNT_0019144581 /DNA_START=207 /DNA_END=2204 /DNA_ORIENTATION=-